MGAGKDINGGNLEDDASDLSILWDKAMPEVVQSRSHLPLEPSLGAYRSLWTHWALVNRGDLNFSSQTVEALGRSLAAGVLASACPEAENLTLGWA